MTATHMCTPHNVRACQTVKLSNQMRMRSHLTFSHYKESYLFSQSDLGASNITTYMLLEQVMGILA